MFCADDGTQLVSEPTPAASLPTIAASAPHPPPPPPPPAAAYQPAPKKRKWLAVIALAFGLFSLPLLLYSISRPLLWEYGFRNLRFDVLFLNLWGVVTVFGIGLAIISVIAGLVALAVSFKKPAQYGGRLLALAGPALSIFLMVLLIGLIAFRRLQGPTFDDFNVSSSNYNSNSNSNLPDNDNSSSNSNSTYAYNSNQSESNDTESAPDSSDMSETDKYRLFYAAAKSGDTSLQQRAARKIGIVDESGMPTSTYESFVKGTVNWAVRDRAWVQQMDTPDEGRAYALERL